MRACLRPLVAALLLAGSATATPRPPPRDVSDEERGPADPSPSTTDRLRDDAPPPPPSDRVCAQVLKDPHEFDDDTVYACAFSRRLDQCVVTGGCPGCACRAYV